MHGELKIVTNSDDKLSTYKMISIGASHFQPSNEPGRSIYTWRFKSKQETIETLERVLHCIKETEL